MFLNYLRSTEIKSVIKNKYNVYDTVLSLRGKKSVLLSGVYKSTLDVPSVNDYLFRSGKLLSVKKSFSKVLFNNIDNSYLGKKFVYTKLLNDFLRLKSFYIRKIVPAVVYKFKGVIYSRRLHSKQFRYNNNRLVFILGKRFLLPLPLISFMHKKLPYKVFKAYIVLRKVISNLLLFYKLYRSKKSFVVLSFSKSVYTKLLTLPTIFFNYSRKIVKLLSALSKMAFIKHKFETLKRFSTLNIAIRERSEFFFKNLFKFLKPFLLIYTLSRRNTNVLLYKFNNFLVLKKEVLIKNLLHSFVTKNTLFRHSGSLFNFSSTLSSLTKIIKCAYLNFFIASSKLKTRSMQYFKYALRSAWFKFLKKFALIYFFRLPNLRNTVYSIFIYHFYKKKLDSVLKSVTVRGRLLLNQKLFGINRILHTLWKLFRFRNSIFIKVLKILSLAKLRKYFSIKRIEKLIEPYKFLRGTRRKQFFKKVFLKNKKFAFKRSKNISKNFYKYATIR